MEGNGRARCGTAWTSSGSGPLPGLGEHPFISQRPGSRMARELLPSGPSSVPRSKSIPFFSSRSKHMRVLGQNACTRLSSVATLLRCAFSPWLLADFVSAPFASAGWQRDDVLAVRREVFACGGTTGLAGHVSMPPPHRRTARMARSLLSWLRPGLAERLQSITDIICLAAAAWSAWTGSSARTAGALPSRQISDPPRPSSSFSLWPVVSLQRGAGPAHHQSTGERLLASPRPSKIPRGCHRIEAVIGQSWSVLKQPGGNKRQGASGSPPLSSQPLSSPPSRLLSADGRDRTGANHGIQCCIAVLSFTSLLLRQRQRRGARGSSLTARSRFL
jgi:hypothetical protein